jgi:hypothetical protein
MRKYDETEPANSLKSPEEIVERKQQRAAMAAEFTVMIKNLENRGWKMNISIFGRVTRYRLDDATITVIRGTNKDEWHLMRHGELVSTHTNIDEALDAGDAIKGIAPAISNK